MSVLGACGNQECVARSKVLDARCKLDGELPVDDVTNVTFVAPVWRHAL